MPISREEFDAREIDLRSHILEIMWAKRSAPWNIKELRGAVERKLAIAVQEPVI